MGESASVPINILEQGALRDETGLLYGDSQTGLKILQAPDGAWRTRHVRLRCFVVRERVNMGTWKVRHLPGSKLASDLLTKVITQPAAWQAFYEFMGLKAAERAALDEAESCEGPGERKSKVAALVGVVVGLAAWKPVEMLGRIARLLGLAAGVVKLSRMFEKKEKRATGRQDPSRGDEPDGIFQLPASQARTLSPQGSRGGSGACGKPWI